jgi:hypothetical protein
MLLRSFGPHCDDIVASLSTLQCQERSKCFRKEFTLGLSVPAHTCWHHSGTGEASFGYLKGGGGSENNLIRSGMHLRFAAPSLHGFCDPVHFMSEAVKQTRRWGMVLRRGVRNMLCVVHELRLCGLKLLHEEEDTTQWRPVTATSDHDTEIKQPSVSDHRQCPRISTA